MTNLISGKEALIALVNGEDIEYSHEEEPYGRWTIISNFEEYSLDYFLAKNTKFKFRLKPRTITLNGIEIPAPFEPKDGDRVWFICDDNDFGYAKSESYGDDIKSFYGWWRTEEEIKQVVSALRSIFKGEVK